MTTADGPGPRGRHIAVEGLDGSGKSTLIARLIDALGARATVREFRLPDPDAIAGRDLVDTIARRSTPPSPQVLALAFAANRLDSVERTVEPFLRAAPGRIALSHRYTLSGLVYQLAQGVPLERLMAVNDGVPRPDLTLFVDTPAAVCEQRVGRRTGDAELFEGQFDLMRKHYLHVIDVLREQGWSIATLDGTRSVPALCAEALALIPG